jgi:hypothetical protein
VTGLGAASQLGIKLGSVHGDEAPFPPRSLAKAAAKLDPIEDLWHE